MQKSDLGCPAVPAPATSHPLLLDLFPQAGVLPNTCPNCGNTNLTKFTSVFMKSPRCFKFSYFMHHFQKTFLFNLLLEEETIPPNQGFTNFTRPHPCQEILLSSSFPHLRIFLPPTSFSRSWLVAFKLTISFIFIIFAHRTRNIQSWLEKMKLSFFFSGKLCYDLIDLRYVCKSNKGNDEM